MAPHKQPPSLFKICINKCLNLINNASYVIEKSYPDNQFHKCEEQALSLKRHLMTVLPARLFEVLCLERKSHRYRGDPRVQLHILTHPKMAVFRRCDVDSCVSQKFWIDNLSNFKRLVVLDLKFICTDEILNVVGRNCPLLEEINIVSRIDICKTVFFNNLRRNVSDAGLCSIAKLKQLRILAMDPPKKEHSEPIGRCVTHKGIIMVLKELLYLEELRIDTCDIGSILIGSISDIGPLSLKKINCHFSSADNIKKLLKICPLLRELSVTHLRENSNNAILEQITMSELNLNKLDLSFFSFTESMEHLLVAKGYYLTHFSLLDMENSLNFDAIICIGQLCPNLNSLCLDTQSKSLIVPKRFQRPKTMFSNLQMLTIGNDSFNIDDILSFFFDCTDDLQWLVLKYQSKSNIDEIFMTLLEKGRLRNISYMWLDCTLQISKRVVKKIIQKCDCLQEFTVEVYEDMRDVYKYIIDNNIDLKIGGFY